MKRNGIQIIKAVTVVTLVTLLLLLILAFMLYKFQMGENVLIWGVYLTYFLANFTGGFIIGKVRGTKKYLWGAAVAVSYFLVLGIFSFLLKGSILSDVSEASKAFLICVGGGVAGGMIS